MTVNGHCTYLPGNQWILNDTYPDSDRNQHLYLYHVESGRRVPLGSFHAPEAYRGEWRCDLHPRSSPDGRQSGRRLGPRRRWQAAIPDRHRRDRRWIGARHCAAPVEATGCAA